MAEEERVIPFWAAPRRCPVEGGELRLLTVAELPEALREGGELALGGGDPVLCSNACLIARVLEREGEPVYPNGAAVLDALTPEEIGRLADRWGAFNRVCNPSPTDGEGETELRLEELRRSSYTRLQWRVLRSFGALPTEARAKAMTDRDYLWCALNLALDREEELERLCPSCREAAQSEACPVCGADREDWGCSTGFDMSRFERMRGEKRND